jgi:predicted phage-related endonuclease
MIHDVKQGSPQWNELRLGRPTSSEFDRLLTPKGKASTQAVDYIYRLVAERVTGVALDPPTSKAMNRGTELEADAVAMYEFLTNNKTQLVGFVTDDLKRYGASPDRLVGEDGLLEVKCPMPHTHVRYLCEEGIPAEYKPQIQGQLFVTGRKWCDSISFCPGFPTHIVRVERDEEYIANLAAVLATLCEQIDEMHRRIKQRMGQL